MDRVKLFKALSDDNRLKIVESLKTSEKCGCTILEELNIVQSTLSHHLKILVECGLVESRKDGKWTYYALNDQGCNQTINNVSQLMTKSKDYITTCSSCD